MSDIVPFNPEDTWLVKASHDHQWKLLPFVNEIFLLETYVAGTSYVENIQEIERDLEAGDSLILKREPYNPYDELAILVLEGKKRKIGYVPRAKNEVLARLMDAGKNIYAQLEDKDWKNSYLALTIKIYLRDL